MTQSLACGFTIYLNLIKVTILLILQGFIDFIHIKIYSILSQPAF